MDCGTGVVGGPDSAFLNSTDGCVNLAGEVAVSVMSPAIFDGDVAVVMALPAVAGAASLADFAEVVAVEVTSSAVAGVAFLADLAGARTEEMTFIREIVVWNHSVFNDSVCCYSEMDCGDITRPLGSGDARDL